MSKMNNALKSYPALHRWYARIHHLYRKYIFHLPLNYKYLLAHINKKTKVTVYCYPEKPRYYHTLYQICNFNGYKFTNDHNADMIFRFEDTTFGKTNKYFLKLSKNRKVHNFRCTDISKEKVAQIQKKAFGYNININPLRHKGIYVKKGNINTLHNGVIKNSPEKPQKGYTYQKYVDSVVEDEFQELRVFIVGKSIPLVYLKQRPVTDMFGSKNNSISLVDPLTVMNKTEYNKILKFCDSFGMDIGELDVIRDKNDNKLYILDANNTPGGPAMGLSMKKFTEALEIVSPAFNKYFLPKAKSVER